ncbi:hypothetical protein BvCmsKSP003_03211 [Escherichia coli]|nr:hypothetical protein BvCmsKSP027_03507 [Escherichia coli]GDL49550.1 hypothetical protein BvCmsKSP003_03211 [Escherichia coli]
MKIILYAILLYFRQKIIWLPRAIITRYENGVKSGVI